MWKYTLLVAVLLYTSSRATVAAESESSVSDAQQRQTQPSHQHQRHHENINQLDDDEPVRYDGAQVWRLGFTDAREKNAVSDLQHNFGNFKLPSERLCVFVASSSVLLCESDQGPINKKVHGYLFADFG